MHNQQSNVVEPPPTLKPPTGEDSVQEIVGPLLMTFRLEAGGKVVEGTMNCPDNDGSVHLPMMVDSMLKQVANSVPAICAATSIEITASIDRPNAKSSDESAAKNL